MIFKCLFLIDILVSIMNFYSKKARRECLYPMYVASIQIVFIQKYNYALKNETAKRSYQDEKIAAIRRDVDIDSLPLR